ncbi:MAG: Gfo/Idh/MocA family oxidoreductase [Clostridia bacterium]|nr:Gfo/Idh/MocA family oxidoreductase [Clostridia bacterium]
MFKTAIVGCGAISKTHAEALRSVKNTELVALCDPNTEKVDIRAKEYGGKVYSSLNDMLDNEKIDVLHICTPHYLHVPMALEALKRGINVLMEKPPAISHDQFAELKKACKTTNAKLGICFQNRYNGAVVEAKRIIEEKKLGKIIGARAIVTWSRSGVYYTESGWRGQIDKEGGGVLINQSIHTLDLMTYIMGAPDKVTAQSSNFHLPGIINEEDSITAYLEYKDKTAVFFATTANCKDAPVLLEFYCENGSLRLEGNSLKVTYSDNTSDFKDYTVRNETGKACWGTSHTLLIGEFYECLEKTKDFPVTLESTVPSFNTMMAVYDSAKHKKSITPGEII